MKKFISLVLALVMALSLTTVAWGATPCVHGTTTPEMIGSSSVEKCSTCNAYLVTAANYVDVLTNATTGTFLLTANVAGNVVIDKGITLDLGGFTITGEVEVDTTEAVVIKNGTITNATDGGAGRCIDTRTNVNVTIDGVALTTTGTGNTQPLTIGGYDNGATVLLKNSTITASASGYAIISFVKTNLTIQNCNNISGYAAIYMKSGSAGSVVNIEKSTLIGNGIAGASNSFSTVVTEDDNVTFNVDKDSTLTATAADAATEQAIFALGAGGNPDVSDVKINVANGAVLTGQILAADAENIANNTVTLPAEYADELVADVAADGYTVLVTTDGTAVIVPAAAITPASTAKGAYYTTDMTNLSVYPSCDTATYKYTLESYTAASENAKTFAKFAIWQTHKVTGAKTIVYTAVYASADSANLAFVNGSQITYLNTVVNTWGGKATPVNAVKVADAAKCGDVFAAGDVGVYTDANGVVYVEKAGFTAYNVGGKMVQLAAALETDVVVDDLATLVPVADTVYTVVHDYAFDTASSAGKTVVTKVSCTECKKSFAFLQGTVAEAIAKFGAGNSELVTIGGNSAYVAGAVATSVPSAGTPSTDKVQSAATFDAGIAMYVGMSVMAAAGSAVVLKKKD